MSAGMRLRPGVALLVLIPAVSCRPGPSPDAVPVSIAQAVSLPEGRAVRVRGVLGLYDPATRTGYLQDGVSGVFVEAAAEVSVPAAGRGVDMEGVVARRQGASYLRARQFRLAPEVPPTPNPRRLAPAGLDDPSAAGIWVATDGVVIQVTAKGRGHALRIEDRGAAFTACIEAGEPDRPNDAGDIRGYHVRAQGVRVSPADPLAADGCTLRLPTRLLLRFLRDAPAVEPGPAPALSTIRDIRALSVEDAGLRRPVRVRGVVTAHDPEENLLFVQDDTAGIYVEAWRHLHEVRPGDTVEVVGRTGPGAFAPIVEWPRLQVVGRGAWPRAVRLEEAVAPQHDSQWIEVDGIGRATRRRRGGAVLELMALGERLDVQMPGVGPEDVRGFVDARVRVRGVYKAAFSATRQLVGVEVHVPRPDLVAVLAPAPDDPFAAPLRRSDTVLEFHPEDKPGRRLHVRGEVTLHRPGRFLYLRDAGGPLRVESRDTLALAPGDEVDVVGFPGVGEFRPVLRDASVRRSDGAARPVSPRDLRPHEAMSGALDGALVRLEGRLLERFASEGETRLLLQTPLHVFEAVLSDAGATFEGLREGSRLAVVGIAIVKGDSARVPQSLQLLLRTADDVTVVERAPWWTVRRAAAAGGALLLLAAGSLAWVATLRRRVREQTEVLRGRLAREAALEERTRLARELHDTLEQNLAGIGYALEAVKHTLGEPAIARSHLDRALTHVDQSMGDARRSVSALRPQALEEGDLASALAKLAGEVTRGRVARADLALEGEPWPLSPGVEDQVFRIAQEALTNALKHAQAGRLRLELGFGAEALELRVEDDGRGFDAAVPKAAGHFGLVGMRERAAKVGGILDVRSAEGRGTTVRLTVPRQRAALPEAG